jgi:hypothetical protein
MFSSYKLYHKGMGMTHNSTLRVNVSGEGINSNNVSRLIVPWAVFAPVGCGDLFP